MRLSILLAVLFFSITASANILAKDKLVSINVGLNAGDKAPPLAVLNQFGNPMQLAQLQRDKGIILVVFRSADWCPFCKKHLRELNKLADDFYKMGYGIAAISYDSPQTIREFSQDKALKFELLADQNQQTFKRYKVLRPDYKMGDKHYGIPFPGVFVIDNKGIIRYKYFYEGYKKRVRFKQLLKQLGEQ